MKDIGKVTYVHFYGGPVSNRASSLKPILSSLISENVKTGLIKLFVLMRPGLAYLATASIGIKTLVTVYDI